MIRLNGKVLPILFASLLLACSSAATKNLDAEGGDSLSSDNSGTGEDGGKIIPLDGSGLGDYKPLPNPGEFGAPCTSNDECDSGYCIEGLDGFICTKLCMEECPDGYECVGVNIGPDVVFICVPKVDRSCEPCTSDLQCSGGRCVEFGLGRYCLAPCDAGPCKNSYECQNVQLDSGSAQLCMPNSTTCECGEESVGLEKSCKQKTGTNVCYGVQFCEIAGWGDCQLPEEVCDAKDNDCNGAVDDPFLNPQTNKYFTDEHCGVCGNSCVAMSGPHAFGSCASTGPVPMCKWDCDDGYSDVNDNPNDGCECEFKSTKDDPDVSGDANCDGLDGVIEEGFFVAKNGEDANPGTMEQPVLTVQQGIELASEEGLPNVYVATGVYSESVMLLPGVHIYGGYSADFESRDPATNQTVIMGLPYSPEAPGAVNAVDILGIPTTVSGFHVFGEDAVDDGGASYAMYVSNCDDKLRLVGNWVIAGNGRDGTHGKDGSDGTEGKDGTDGLDAYDIMHDNCTSGDWTDAGQGGKHSCGQSVNGGNGGTGICPDYDETGSQPKSSPYDQSQTGDEWGKDGSGSQAGEGGEPGYDGLLWSGYSSCGVCNVPKNQDGTQFLPSLGAAGGHGDNGSNGFAAGGCVNPAGDVVGGLWLGTPGSWGGDGDHGSGGGGGGAGGGVETIGCADKPLVKYTDVGGSGGGGGSGGCSGAAAEGGNSGGASFALFVAGDSQAMSVPRLEGNYFQTGFGGDGGDGGAGGVGGEGGKGAAGGYSGENQGSAWCADAGGHGGNGGRGGHGGGGGGGCGGPSFGIFLFGPSANLAKNYLNENEFVLMGDSGEPGVGGKSMGSAGSAGEEGPHTAANFQ